MYMRGIQDWVHTEWGDGDGGIRKTAATTCQKGIGHLRPGANGNQSEHTGNDPEIRGREGRAN